MLRRILAVLSVALLLLPLGVEANTDLEARQRERRQVQQRMQEAERRAAAADQQARSVLTELQTIERNIDRTTQEIRTLESRLRTAESELRRLTRELDDASQRLTRRNKQLGMRLRVLYERGAVSYLEVLFQARSFADFISRFSLLRMVINQDIVIYHAVQEERAVVAERREEAVERRTEIASLREQKRVQQTSLQSRAASRTTLLNNLNQDKQAAVQAYNELNRLAEELDRVIRELEARNRGVGTGTFTWPVPGNTRITSPFGWRTHPIFRTREFHSGIDIGAPSGRNIVASDGGTVLWADWLGGYGRTVIISHGAFSSLYAHASTLLVEEGDRVIKGQVIARIGSTGHSTGPHLHFEVRNQAGTRLNPSDHVRP
ncbi:MAG: Murein hydrolase activator EnvC [Firmicutes bacterium]|nr:Murein hydrolase activator EnvC [candidate division NPL-UPA2 bacterium]